AGERELAGRGGAIVVAVEGSVSTFSPELMEAKAPEYNNFVFGNILAGDLERFASDEHFQRSQREVAAGVAACKAACRYFAICGGGSPVNKLCEKGDLTATETEYCRLAIQSPADALLQLLARARDGAVRPGPTVAAARTLAAAK